MRSAAIARICSGRALPRCRIRPALNAAIVLVARAKAAVAAAKAKRAAKHRWRQIRSGPLRTDSRAVSIAAHIRCML